MASPFDGVGAALLAVLGEACTITPPAGATRTVRAIFRDEPSTDEYGRAHRSGERSLTLKVRKSSATGLIVGTQVTTASRPGEAFVVNAAVADATPGDTFVVCMLEPAS